MAISYKRPYLVGYHRPYREERGTALQQLLPSAHFGSDSVVNEVMGARMAQVILQCSIVQLGAEQYSAVQYGSVQRIDVHRNTVHCIEFRAV